MANRINLKVTKLQSTDKPENLPVIYNSLLSYINTVVTFRFTTLSLYLATVAVILNAKPSIGIYILLCVITISIYIIEIRNRYIKNDLEARAKQIEHKWGYTVNRKEDYKPESITIFNIVVPIKAFKTEYKTQEQEEKEVNRRQSTTSFGETILPPLITHSIALDFLYSSILLYALVRLILLLECG